MKVLIFSQYYFPEGVPKPHELAESLADMGHEVTVLTGLPHYPGGKLSKGYSISLFQKEMIRGIPVRRTFEIPYHSINPLLRIANYISFLISAPFGAFFTPKCDVIYVWHPPLTVGIAAWLISKIKRAPFVYDVQDIWGGFVVLSGMVRDSGLMVKLIRRLEQFVSRKAAKLIVQTEAGRKYFNERGVPSEKIAVLPNWADENDASLDGEAQRNLLRDQFGWNDDFVLLFAGNLGIVQALDAVIEAASSLVETNVRIVFVGDGTDKPRLEKLTSDLNINGVVQFIQRQPMEKMPAFLAAADALLVHLKKSELTQFVIPSKTNTYLASGKPILLATGGAAADLIKAARAGIVVEPENAAQICEAIKKMRMMSPDEREAMGHNGLAYFRENLSRKQVTVRYEKLLRDVVEKWKATK